MADEDGVRKDKIKCGSCEGTGERAPIDALDGLQSCNTCNGTGYLTRIEYDYQKAPDYWDGVDDPDIDSETLEVLEALQRASPQAQKPAVSYVVNQTELPHSLGGRLSGPGSEFKLYGKNVQHLVDQVKELAEHPDLPLALQTLKTRYAETKESK